MYYVIVISLKDIEKFNSYEDAEKLYNRLIANGFDAVLTKKMSGRNISHQAS